MASPPAAGLRRRLALGDRSDARGAALPIGLLHGVQLATAVTLCGLVALLWVRRRRRRASGVLSKSFDSPPPPPQSPWVLVFMCFLGGTLAYIARSMPSIALPYIAADLVMTHGERAAFLSAFFYGYMPANLAAGIAVRAYGAGRVLCAAVLLWSACTAALPFCANAVSGLVVVRILTALAQAPLMPCCYQLLSCVLETTAEKTRANCCVNAGSQFGVALCYFFVPTILEGGIGGVQPHWHTVFYITGALGAVWSAGWVYLGLSLADLPERRAVKQPPQQVSAVGQSEQATSGGGSGSVPWRRLCSTPAFHALAVGHFTQNWGVYIFLAWLPTFFREALHMDKGSAGLAAVPYCGTTVGCLTAGIAGDVLVRKCGAGRLMAVRRTLTAAGFVIPAVLLAVLANTTDQTQAVALVTLALSCLTLLSAGVMSGHYDLATDLTGVLASVTNAIGTLPGIFGIMLCQVLVDATHSWSSVFYLTSVLYLAATVIYFAFGSVEKHFE
eukprot:TRINITY_DN43478_c0_g1_i1.p1 TRINITY_DN43478_c0_g1~~TRINITY_DN43478_c0_g1_i1.p1  ORF type:complete len:501 (+),score=136.17 TRINITY_DN43478_c0_g1_i1:241-1743(+)